MIGWKVNSSRSQPNPDLMNFIAFWVIAQILDPLVPPPARRSSVIEASGVNGDGPDQHHSTLKLETVNLPACPNATKLLLPLVMVLGLPNVLQAQFDFVTNNGSITLTRYTGSDAGVTIPSETNGLPVTRIGSEAFYLRTIVTSVTIPDSVTGIGDSAFYACTNLNSVTIGASLNSIGSYAFAYCSRLSSVTLPDSVSDIGNSSFAYCSSLPGIVIGDNVIRIGAGAFYFCSSLSTAWIGHNVSSIGEYAFASCPSLTTVTVPAAVTNIGERAFFLSTGLITITVNPLNPSYGSVDGVLFDKSQTTLIQYPAGKPGSYTSPPHVCRISADAFYACAGLTSILIPDVTSIGDYAFFRSSLTSATFGNHLTSIGNWAFANCGNLTSITMPGSITNIGERTFFNCASLAAVYFKGNAIRTDPYVFGADTNVTVYYLPGTTGWGPTFAGRPTAFWRLPYPLVLAFPPGCGVLTNGFGFIVSWATNAEAVVETCTNLTTPAWVPASTNTLLMGLDPLRNGWFHFSNPEWTNDPSRFYRVRSP